MTIFIILLTIIIVLLIVGSFIAEPNLILFIFRVSPKKFRLHKPQNEADYYLQVRIWYVYYYIYKNKDDYSVYLNFDKNCIKYSNHYIISMEKKIYDDRYEIIKYFSDTSSPEDNIKLD